MKFTPTKFYAAFADGLLEMTGYAFQAIDRTFVLHLMREPYREWDKNYKVSDAETGFGFPIPDTRNRQIAAQYALEVLNGKTPQQLQICFEKAAIARKTLKVIKRDPT